jgi:alkanesulfonate monooxygenase SsuD/methylene tetrahydromethanopterin reductase-like flavin-dependent oxidoreductase (luciferase family)
VHIGFSSAFGNPGNALPDTDAYRRDLDLFDLAEPLGFDSVWTVEHHFSGYNMSPSPLVFLAYMAGRTTRVKLGSQVVVLPWHDPLRVAEEVALLDNVSGGRFIFGMGRGLARHEYDGYRVEIDSSRERFQEYAQMIMSALETGVAEFDGTYLQQPPVTIRPAPLRSFSDRVYVASMSSEAMEPLARLGVGLKIVVQKPWPSVMEDVENYSNTYREVHGTEAPAPIVTSPLFVHEDSDVAQEVGVKWLSAYFRSVVEHYGFDKPYGGPGDVYKKMSANIAKHGFEAMGAQYAKLCPCGTPDQVVEAIAEMRANIGIGGFIGQFQYAGMPADVAEANLRLFADKVLPRVHELEGSLPIDDAPMGHTGGDAPSEPLEMSTL